MSRIDRAVARARRHLKTDETLVASTVGVEADGRRRKVVVLTDQRLFVVGLRDDAPVELSMAGCVTGFDVNGGLFSLSVDDEEIVLRQVDAAAAHRLDQLLTTRRGTLGYRGGGGGHVHLRPDPPADGSSTGLTRSTGDP